MVDVVQALYNSDTSNVYKHSTELLKYKRGAESIDIWLIYKTCCPLEAMDAAALTFEKQPIQKTRKLTHQQERDDRFTAQQL